MILAAVLALLAGLLVGSFLNVCIHRIPAEMSIVRPRSFCPKCGKQIAWYDNVPLLSYALLRGRCRYCREPIRWRYPLVEAICGLAFFAAVYANGVNLLSLKLCIFSALTIGLVFLDLEARILPDEFTIGGTVAGLIFAVFVPLGDGVVPLFVPPEWSGRVASLIESAIGAAVGGVTLWVVGRLYQRIRKREGLGGGDPLMVAMTGAFLGLHGALATVLLGSLLGSVVGLAYIYIAKKDPATYELPFGSFIGIAALIVALRN